MTPSLGQIGEWEASALTTAPSLHPGEPILVKLRSKTISNREKAALYKNVLNLFTISSGNYDKTIINDGVDNNSNTVYVLEQ